jgi:hypothetical protein
VAQSKQSRRLSSSGKGFSLPQYLDSAHVGRIISVPGGGTGRVVTTMLVTSDIGNSMVLRK